MFKFNYKEIIDHRLAGIPCQIGVRKCKKVSRQEAADNPYDYYGYCDVDYDILDSRGKPAAWLENKATPADHDEIVSHIIQVMQ